MFYTKRDDDNNTLKIVLVIFGIIAATAIVVRYFYKLRERFCPCDTCDAVNCDNCEYFDDITEEDEGTLVDGIKDELSDDKD